MKVYITTHGSYSSYGLDRVFASRALAEFYIKAMQESNFDEESISDEVLEEEVIEKALQGRTRHALHANWWAEERSYRSKGWEDAYEMKSLYVEGEEADDPDDDPRKDLHVHFRNTGNGLAILEVSGWDLERVRKVFGEVKAQKTIELEGLE